MQVPNCQRIASRFPLPNRINVAAGELATNVDSCAYSFPLRLADWLDAEFTCKAQRSCIVSGVKAASANHAPFSPLVKKVKNLECRGHSNTR